MAQENNTFTIDDNGAPNVSDNGSNALQESIINSQFDASDLVNAQIKDPQFIGTGYTDVSDIEMSYYNDRLKDTNFSPSDFYGKSDDWTIAKNAVRQFGAGLMTLGDQAELALGGVINLATGGEIGKEFLEQGYTALDNKLSEISNYHENVLDSESNINLAVGAIGSAAQMAFTGLATGGIFPMVQIGIQSLGDGTYNNIQKHLNDGGTIDNYKTGGFDFAIDMTNAALQVGSERYLGFGGKYIDRILYKTAGSFIKETAAGVIQESAQEFMTDVAEVMKSNQHSSIYKEHIKNYIMAGVAGGLVQGAMGVVVYKYNHGQAVNRTVEWAKKNGAEDTIDLRKAVDRDITLLERGIVNDYWQETAAFFDANNNRGKLKDHIVAILTESVRKRNNMADDDELDLDDIQDIQDQSTLFMREAVRLQWEQNLPVANSFLFSMKTDENGNISIPELGSLETKTREEIDSIKEKIAKAEDIKAEKAKIAEFNKSLKELEAVAKKQQRENAAVSKTQVDVADLWNTPKVKKTRNVIKQSGITSRTKRGAFNSKTRKIILSKKSDVSSTIHEFMHAFAQAYFMFQRSGSAGRTFQQNWGAVERWAGIRPEDKFMDKDASEKLARAYEKWVMEGGKGAPDALQPIFKRLSEKFADIYDDYKLGYFKEVGKLSKSVEDWFANNEKLYLLINNREPDELEKKREQITNEEDDKFNTGKQRERGISKAVRKSTQEQTGVELEKNMYTQRAVKEAVLTAPEFVQANPDQSYEIIMGAPEVGGYRREELFAAYLDFAQNEITNGNMEYVYRLQNIIKSEMAVKRTEEGQRNAALRKYDNNIIRIDETLRELQQVSESEKATVKSESSELEMSIQKTDESINIDEVLKEVECQ